MSTLTLGLAGLVGLSAYFYGPATHSTLTKLGVFRTLNDTAAFSSTTSPLGESIRLIDDTVHCEDLHYYAPGHVLFTACEDVNTTRFEWFPPLESCSGAKEAAQKQGSIHIIDPETHKSTRLTFENFNDPFITHGIDVIPASSSHPSEAVYIFAVNHIPGAGSLAPSSSSNKDNNNKKKKCHLASRIDVFHHTLGTTTARYLHSISHPSIHTPNDVYGVSANEIYVTNDRWYEEGFMTMVETLWPGAKWSDVVHATRAVDHEREGEGEAEAVQQAEIQANIAIDKLRIPNGLGHGRTDDEILLTSAFGGIMWLGTFSSSAPEAQSSSSSSEPTIQINDTVDLASTIDNPSWYQDQYISSSGNDNDDASGFVLAGLKRAINLGTTGTDPHGREGVMVWYVKPNAQLPAEKWEKKLLWEDDGGLIRNAATAVLVGIDPAKEKSAGGEGGGKKAWLYVTGFSSQSAVAVKVDL